VGICGVADFLHHTGSLSSAAWRVANIILGGAVMVTVDRIPGIRCVLNTRCLCCFHTFFNSQFVSQHPHKFSRDWAIDDLRALTVKTLTDTALVVKETSDSTAYGFQSRMADTSQANQNQEAAITDQVRAISFVRLVATSNIFH
jgi:hypothetical protein